MRSLLLFLFTVGSFTVYQPSWAEPINFSFVAGNEERPQLITITPKPDLGSVSVMVDGMTANFEGRVLFFQFPSGGGHENNGMLESFVQNGVAIEKGAWSNTFVLILNGRLIYFNGFEILTFQIPSADERDLEQAMFEFYYDPQQRFELINVDTPMASKVYALEKTKLWESVDGTAAVGTSIEGAIFKNGQVTLPAEKKQIKMREVGVDSVVRIGPTVPTVDKGNPGTSPKKSAAVGKAIRLLSSLRITVDRNAVPLSDFLKSEFEILDAPIANRMDYVSFEKELQMAQAGLSMSQGGGVRVTGRAGTGKSYFLDTYLSYLLETETEPLLAIRLAASSLIAGDGLVGVTDRKIQALKTAAKQVKVVLFIDEMHTLVGAGRYKGNNVDFFQHIKSELASGQIKIIGTTTDQEWEQNFSSDKALMERFPINIKMSEPSDSKVTQILAAFLKGEGKNRRVTVSEDVMKKLAQLATRFDPIGGNPRKSVRLLDFAVSMAAAKKKLVLSEDDLMEYASHLYDYDLRQLDAEKIRQKLMGLGAYLDQNLIGMKSSKAHIEKALGAHFFDQFDQSVSSRPFGMMLYGKRGVGKTALATHLAKGLGFSFTKIMMADYATPMDVSAFKTRLAMAVKTNPFSVILLDEIEKSHPDVQRALLQVMDDGRFEAQLSESYSPQTGGNSEVDASKTLFVYTTNAGQSLSNSKVSEVQFQEAAEHEGVNSYLLDRIGEFVAIPNPTVQDIKDIVALKWGQYKAGLARKGRSLNAKDDVVIEHIVKGAISQEIARTNPTEGIGFLSRMNPDTALENIQLSVRELERRVTDISQDIAQFFVRNPTETQVQLNLKDGQLLAMSMSATPATDSCEAALTSKSEDKP